MAMRHRGHTSEEHVLRDHHILSSTERRSGAALADPTNRVHEQIQTSDPNIDGNGPVSVEISPSTPTESNADSLTMSSTNNRSGAPSSSSPVSRQQDVNAMNSVQSRREMMAIPNKKRGNLRRNARGGAGTGGAAIQIRADEDELMFQLDQEEVDFAVAAAASSTRLKASPTVYHVLQPPRSLEDVDYWRKRAGWFDDDETMNAYNEGVQDTYYATDDNASSSGKAGSKISFSSKAAKKAMQSVLITLAVLIGLITLTKLCKRCSKKNQTSREKLEKLTSKDKSRYRADDDAKSRKSSKSRDTRKSSKSRDTRKSSRSQSRSKSRSGRSRSRSRSHRERSDYELMEDGGRHARKSSRSSRSKSKSRSSRSKSRSRTEGRDKPEMLV